MSTLSLVRICAAAALLCAGCSSTTQEYRPASVSADELRSHVRYLASDELRGRLSGEEGNRLAARYVADAFQRFGLKPGGDSGYFQNFPFVASVKEGPESRLSVATAGGTMSFPTDDQFRPLSFSSDTTLTAALVFSGYGISADTLHFNEYAGMNVRNKIVLVCRYAPDGDTSKKFADKMTLVAKAYAARDSGAAGIIFITSPSNETGSELIGFRAQINAPIGIASGTMLWSAADSLFRACGKDLRASRDRIASTGMPGSYELPGAQATLRTQVIKVRARTANVVGILEGSDPHLRDEALVIGAHMDHLGMGGQGSGSLQPDTVAIHHGADDNASGTAGMLELARTFSSRPDRPRRTMIFMAFSGEELGLLGSAWYAGHPTFPLDRTVAMINMDMIGRLKDSILVVEGMGTSSAWEPLVRSENRDSLFHLKLKPDGFGPSDHSSFYAKDIPVMFFFTNLHGDYHRPSDTWEKINYEGERAIVEYVSSIAETIATRETRPPFTKAPVSMAAAGGDERGEVRVSLGVIPDFADEGTGLKITGTRNGSAAEKAGLKGNDIIIKFGADDVKNIYDFTHLLGKYKPGDEVTIVVKRGTGQVSLKAVLEARK